LESRRRGLRSGLIYRSVIVPKGRSGLIIYFLGKGIKDRLDMDDKFNILDVVFVIETLCVGYLLYLLWGTL
jgi:hypothetical protein